MSLDATLFAPILSGALRAWPEEAPDPGDAVEEAIAHGVAPLLAQTIGRGARGWPAPFAAGLVAAARGEVALAGIRERALTGVLEALAAGGVRVLVIKGAHLAYVLYESPELRPRWDTDLLIDEADRERTREILERLGTPTCPMSAVRS